MTSTATVRTRWASLALVVAITAACGGSSDNGSSAGTSDNTAASGTATDSVAVETDVASDDAGDAASQESSSDGATDAPETDVGSVVIGGETFELTGPSRSDVIITSGGDPDASAGDFDFEICETVNPAFAGAVNISGTLGDGTEFRLSGNVDEGFEGMNGLFLGDMLDEEQADDVDVSLDGRTLSGTATTSRGDVEFTFTC